METNFKLIGSVVGVWILLFISNSVLFSQKSFSYMEIDEKRNIGLLSYDGSKKTIADGDTIKLQSFTYLSVGRIKKLISVSNGCVYVLIEYPKKQLILIKSNDAKSFSALQKMDWEEANIDELNRCLVSDDRVSTSDYRRSFYKQNDSQTIAILNVRKQDVALFMYMAESISFD